MIGHDFRRVQLLRCDNCTHRFGNHEGGRCYAWTNGKWCDCTAPVKFKRLGWALTALVVLVVGLAMGGGW